MNFGIPPIFPEFVEIIKLGLIIVGLAALLTVALALESKCRG